MILLPPPAQPLLHYLLYPFPPCSFVPPYYAHTNFSQKCCCCFSSGRSRTVQFWEQDGISVLSKVNFWVESRLGNQTMKSQEISQYLYNWSELSLLPAPLSPPMPPVLGLRTSQVQGDKAELSHRTPCHWALVG